MSALGRHSLILMLDVRDVRIFSSPCILNGRQGGHQFERPGRDSTKMGGAV